MNPGWFRIHRKLFENELWKMKPFSKGQAWIDLIGGANYVDGSFFIRGNEIKLKRGELGWSELTLAERWGWSRNKVRGFLALLENRGQIEQQKLHKLTTIIRIKNYDMYQNDTTDNTTEGQQKDNRRYTTNKVKKNKEEIKRYTEANLSLEDVAEKINEAFNVYLGRKFKGIDSFKNNLEYWLGTYQPKEIEEAIKNIKYDKFWRDKMTPTILFRRKNPQGEPVDYISQLLIKENDGYPR